MYDAVVFAGGGSRCFWQAGFYAAVSERHALAPTQVAAVSAGSAMACLAATGGWSRALAHFKAATARNPRNFYPSRLLRGDAFPHLAMYRDALLAALSDDAFDRLRRGPEIRILLARPPRWSGHRRAALVAFAAYTAEVYTVRPVHTRFARRLGFLPEVVRAQDCRTPDELADLILHSSCTPPFTPLFRRDGRPVLDGGAVDPVPTLALHRPGRTLVLLTKRYPAHRLPRVPNTDYQQPSAEIPITKWDYTNPAGLQAAFDLGRRDGDALARRLAAAA